MLGLNNFIKNLGCKETHFTNPHGLHHPKHSTTPYDMAIIAREAMKNATFREIVAASKFIKPKTNKQESLVILQKNRLLRTGRHYYPKAIGVKIGYTSIAKHTIVAAAKHEDRELIVVLMKCEDSGEMYRDAIRLFDAAFNQEKVQKILLKSGVQKYTCQVNGADKPIKTYTTENLGLEFYPAEEPAVKCYLEWLPNKTPILKDQIVGELQLKTLQGQLIQKVNLFAQEDIHETWLQWISNFL